MNTKVDKLKGHKLKISELNNVQINEMFELFARYYDNAKMDKFTSDLKEKDYVFTFLDSEKRIRGFSTIVSKKVKVDNKEVYAHFSGDTVIDKPFWGQRVLGIMFLTHLFQQKLKNIFYPHYWLLITKGYKTYLIMANNFSEHYPRFEKQTPSHDQEIINVLASKFFSKNFDKKTGLLHYSLKSDVEKDSLKENVAAIDENLIKENNRIRFFVENNPAWDKGDELVCIAKMALSMPVKYQIKSLAKLVNKNISFLSSSLKLNKKWSKKWKSLS